MTLQLKCEAIESLTFLMIIYSNTHFEIVKNKQLVQDLLHVTYPKNLQTKIKSFD